MVLEEAGPNAKLILRTNHEVRSPSHGEVCIRIDACAVAFRDILDRTGAFPFIKRNAVLGHEFAGTVKAVGENTNLQVGERVVSLHWDQTEAWPSPLTPNGPVNSFIGLTVDGGYAEYCTVTEGTLVRVPNGWSAIQAAPVMSTFGTVWQGAKVRARLNPEDTVLVTGCSGGVGSSALQICKAIGCKTVIAVTSSQNKVGYLKKLGADEIIITDDQNPFHKNSKVLSLGGCDVAIECVGGPTFLQSLRCLKPEGRLVLVGNVSNSTVPLPLGLCILKSLSVVGSDSIFSDELIQLFRFLSEENLRPNIDHILPLEKANEAHALLENKCVSGRIVLQISPDNWVD
eukprot:CAMPEP_0204837948 /NCGR_PEP_ID=MMETSP1346-20131115/29363_1 /ASSEMBLY_ACC=CAM_ASM_000771 /TAXON_ID=215587 /ORGANISM="Aplanochytrium stocchinoi, Strain GSBS06" /LENGTH=343 /DNA_ID=CAMNT_0051973681 /DNA_START=80 /DNA_END=1111 /DNA_ORIENTATION=+